MQRKKAIFPLAKGEDKTIKQKMLNWAQPFSIFLFLDSNDYSGTYSRFECLFAAKPRAIISGNEGDLLSQLNSWHKRHNDWLFGHVCYDYKNLLEKRLSSSHPVQNGYPQLHFFFPALVCYISKDKTTFTIESADIEPEDIFKQIVETDIPAQNAIPKRSFKQRVEKTDYLSTIGQLRKHIRDGDCYEINYCCEGYCEDVETDPLIAFRKLNELSFAPFSAYYRLHDQYMMCASPERYLFKEGKKVLSQPMKGTARRDQDPQQDEAIRNALYYSIKDRAENVMIVDLVRNDLARSCETGSVTVDELFGIYTFPQVHQMISTVSGALTPDFPLTDVIRYSFPMGSMTGAPKVKVMELIDKYEHSRRELFSGTVGYITPEGDFDFNVIIRSLFYNASAKYLSYLTGGAITYDSDAEQEWEEMRLKAWALERVFA